MRRHALDALIVLAAAVAALQVALAGDAAQAPRTTPWFAVPAIVAIVLTLLARRRFPLAAPAGLWLLAAAVSFVDGRLVVYVFMVSLAGVVAAFLLGNLPAELQSRAGLAVVVGCAAVVVSNDPQRDSAELVFIPLLFAIA